MRSVFRALVRTSVLKTLYLNFAVLPVQQAMRFPILVSRHVKIDHCRRGSVVISGSIRPGMIRLGYGGSVGLDSYQLKRSYFSIRGNGKLEFVGKANFSPHFSILVADAVMRVGKDFYCNNGCSFSCMEGLTFGDHCLLGGDIEIRDSDGHTVIEIDESGELIEKENRKPVVIGKHVWLCSRVRILKGVQIGDDCVVAYGSLCTKPSNGTNRLIGGYPAKVLQEHITWRE